MPPLPKTDKVAPSRPRQRHTTSSSISVNGTSDTMAHAASPPTPTGSVRLSMPISPSETSALSVSRPAAPRIRSKRMSASATPSPRASPAPRTKSLAERPGSAASSIRTSLDVERYTGSIVDRTEEEVALASRDALQNALRKEWADREQLMARLEEQDNALRDAERRAAENLSANEALQTKFDSLYNEQSVLESELEAANEVVEHLRSNLAEVERQNRQGQRRYADQEKAFEAERLVHQAEHQHLQQRIKSLMTERVARPGNDESHAALQEELATLTASHQTLIVQLTTLADEIHEVKAENEKLQEENESWQLLIEDRTLAGAMRGGLLSPHDSRGPSPSAETMRRPEPNMLETLEEQMEMDELNNEMDAQQSYFDDEPGRGIHQISPTKPNGLSLALEISAAPKIAEVEALRAEVKSLKEANRALSLYCSKILDRIMAHEGFEQVLSTDYRTRRFGTRSASQSSKARPSAEELAKTMEQNGTAPGTAAPPALPEPVKEPAKEAAPAPAPAPAPAAAPAPVPAPASAPAARKARPQSMLPTSSAQQALPKPSEMKKDGEKVRARRGFSIDFRSLGFGGTEPKPEPKPQLKPLQLASRAAPANSQPTSTSPPKPSTSVSAPSSRVVSVARKLEPQEEDEEDRRERHRMEAALKLMGIDKAETPPSESQPLPANTDSAPATPVEAPIPSASGAGNWFSRRLSRAPSGHSQTASVPTHSQSTTPVAADRGTSTPLGRLSAALGGGVADPVLAGLVDLSDHPSEDPDLAAAALRAYDEREREQARLISEGKNETAFTSPPTLSRAGRSRPSSGSSASFNSGTGHGNGTANGTANGHGHHGHRKLDSISTLWSMGSSRASLDQDRAANDYSPSSSSISHTSAPASASKIIRVTWDEKDADGTTRRHTHTAFEAGVTAK